MLQASIAATHPFCHRRRRLHCVLKANVSMHASSFLVQATAKVQGLSLSLEASLGNSQPRH
jgi:hypothetical protein